MEKSAIILVRVSTLGQDTEPQKNALLDYAKELGYNKIHIINTKESGLVDSKDKIGTEEMFTFLENNSEYKTVICSEISRLARRQSILHSLREWFINNRIQLYIKDGKFQLFDSDGEVPEISYQIFTLYGMFAESEIRAKKFRFQQAKTALMKEGLSIPGKELFGYVRVPFNDKRNTYQEHPENAEIVRKIFFWYLNGIEGTGVKETSITKIVRHCQSIDSFPKYTSSKRNVNKLLKEEAYTGYKITCNKRKNPEYENNIKLDKYITTKTEIKYPQIISRDDFDKVQDLLKKNNSRVEKSNIYTTLLSKLIECESCSNFFIANYREINEINKSSYRCSGRSKPNPCKNKNSVSLEMLDSAIWAVIKSDIKAFSAAVKQFNPDEELRRTENLIFKLKEQISNIELELENISDFKIVLKKLKNHKTASDNIADIGKQISKYDKQLGKLNDELLLLESKKRSIEAKGNNLNTIINSNLELIEKSKDTVKSYINFFIDKINIQFHSVRFTIVKIKLKYYTRSKNNKEFSDLDEYVFLLIDKHQTLNIKLYKATCSIRFISKEKFRIGSNVVHIDELQNIDNELLKQKPRLLEIKELPFKRYRYKNNILVE